MKKVMQLLQKYIVVCLAVNLVFTPLNSMYVRPGAAALRTRAAQSARMARVYGTPVRRVPAVQQKAQLPQRSFTDFQEKKGSSAGFTKPSQSWWSAASVLGALGLGWLWESSDERQDAQEVLGSFENSYPSDALYTLIAFLKKYENSDEADKLFEQIIANDDFLRKLSSNFRDTHSRMPDELIPYVKKNYMRICTVSGGAYILAALMNNGSKEALELTDFVKNNFDELCKKAQNYFFLDTIIKHNPNALQEFSQVAKGKVSLLVRTEAGKQFIDEVLVKEDSEIAKERALSLFDSEVPFSPRGFDRCIIKLQDDADVERLIHATYKNNDFSSVLKKMIYQKHCNYCSKDDLSRASTSVKYLNDNIDHLSLGNIIDKYVVQDPGLSHMVMDALKKEEEVKGDCYTLYHGQGSQLGFQQRWFSWLNNPQDDLMLPVIYSMPETQDERIKEDVYIMNRKDMFHFEGERRSTLYATGPLFANITMRLAVLNSAASSMPLITVEKTFKDAHKSEVYYHFKDQLEELEDTYNELHQKGQLLQFNVRKDKINDFVFLSGDGGPTVTVEGVGETTDAGKVLEALRSNPDKIKSYDYSFGVRISSHLMKPNSGIKCKIFNSVDPAEWAEYEKKEKQLRASMLRYMESKPQYKVEQPRFTRLFGGGNE